MRKLKIITSLLITICMIVTLMSVISLPAHAAVVTGYTNQYTYVRMAPYWTASVVDTMASGVTIKIQERDYDYIYIEYTKDGITKRGYIPRANSDATGYSWCVHDKYLPATCSASKTVYYSETSSTSCGTISSGQYPLLILRQHTNGRYFVQYSTNASESGTPKFVRGWITSSSVAYDKPTAPSYLFSDTNECFNTQYTEIMNSSGQYLTAVADSSQASGYKLSFTSSTHADNQQWILHRTIDNGAYYYKIESFSTGLYIEVENKIPVTGAYLILTAETSPNKAQEFSLENISSGGTEDSYIRARCSGDYLVAQSVSNGLALAKSTSSNVNLTIDVYETNEPRVQQNINFIPHNSFNSTTIANFNAAINRWQTEIGLSYLSVSTTNTHSTDNYIKADHLGDGMNRIYYQWHDGSEAEDPNDLQTIHYQYDLKTGKLYEADILVNSRFTWCNGAVSGSYDYGTVFTHEIGHALGLDHTAKQSVMNTGISVSGVLRNYIYDYDKRIIKIIY